MVKHDLVVCWFIQFCMGKIAQALQRECSFSSTKSNELTDQQDIFSFNHVSVFYMNKKIVKNIDDTE